MVDLDPEEERLLAEAMFETANEDLSGPALEFVDDASVVNDGENVPNSKVQFPIRRSKSSRKRKMFCVVTLLFLLFGALLLTYFLLKAKTFSFEFKLSKGQVLHYRLTQENTYEGLKTVHTSFADDVFVQIVNKTGSRCWMKVFLKTLPKLKTGPLAFLVSVNLGGQNSVDIDDEERLKVFTPWKKKNITMDYYVLNLLTQLLPVVKIDLFEVILSQITTRKHEVIVENSKFFSGDATMKQNIRMSKDDILITSKIAPEGFSSFASNSDKLKPRISFSFEEDTSISKSTGMITTSDMELSAKLPIAGELGDKDSKTELSMRFKSSLRLVNEKKTIPDGLKNEYGFTEMPELPNYSKKHLKYISPSYKKYDEKHNVVKKVKDMLNMTIFTNSDSTKHKKNKDMEEFVRSFHKIAQPGVETNFAEIKEKRKERFPDRHKTLSSVMTTPMPKTNPEDGHLDSYNDGNGNDDDDDYNIDNEPSPDDDDDDGYQYDDGEDGGRWNRFGQYVPQYPEDETDNLQENYSGPPEDSSEDVNAGREPQNDVPKTLHEHKNNTRKHLKSTDRTNTREDKKLSDGKTESGSQKDKTNKVAHHSEAEKAISAALYREGKKLLSKKSANKSKKTHQTGHISKENLKKSSKVSTSKKALKNITNNETMTTPEPPLEQKNIFDRIFDQLWRDDDNHQDEKEENDDSGFKLSNFIPSFSFSSDFPFIHLKWHDSDSRKKRSLESANQPRARRDVNVHRDKRRLFGDDGAAPYYTSRDLEPIWDVISPATIKERSKQTSRVFQHRIMGLEVNGDLEHEVKVVNSSNKGNEEGWEIDISLLLSVDKHEFKVLRKIISMKEIEQRFLKESKPKLEYGTVHAGTLVLCSPLFYIEKVCVEIQLGFVLHVSHTIEYISKEYPIELSIFFKHLAKVDVTISSHMTSLLGSHGVYGHGPLFGAKIPLEIRFSEEKNSAKWCSIANLKSKIGDFYESSKDMTQWSCSIDEAVKSNAICEGLNKNSTNAHKAATKLWYRGSSTKKLHFLNNC